MVNKEWDKNIDKENINTDVNTGNNQGDWDTKKQSDSDQEAIEGLGDMLEKNTPPC